MTSRPEVVVRACHLFGSSFFVSAQVGAKCARSAQIPKREAQDIEYFRSNMSRSSMWIVLRKIALNAPKVRRFLRARL